MITIERIEFNTHCHATEDCNKVLQAILNTIPSELHSELVVSKQILHGYYGNPIVLINAVLNTGFDKFLEYLSSKLSESDKAILTVTLDLRYDHRGNKLYLRLSKQDAYNNRFTLYDGDDVVKIIISFKGGRGLEKIREYLKSKGLIK